MELATLSNTTDLAALFGNQDAMEAFSGGDVIRRISLKGGAFTTMAGKQIVTQYEERKLKVVILTAAKLHRKMYLGKYNPDNPEPSKLICWSSDTQVPHAEVKDKPASKCMGCKYNIEGSGQNGKGKACRFSQTIAVAILDEDGNIGTDPYLLNVPAASIFGEQVVGKGHRLLGYVKHLAANRHNISAIVTEIKFEVGVTTRLLFNPIRVLTKEEIDHVVTIHKNNDLTDMVALKAKIKEDTPATESFETMEVAAPNEVVAIFADDSVSTKDVPPPTKASKVKPTVPTGNPTLAPDLVAALDDFDA